MNIEEGRLERPERSSYTPIDFMAFRDAKSLDIVPKFQRRPVWKAAARAYLIDTLLRGLPVPPIYMRVTQSPERTRTIREVIDGQQRIRAVLDFIDDSFPLSRASEAHSGKYYSDLPSSAQSAIREYSFICEILHGVSDTQVLEIFARLNTYSIPLNQQELRNGTYFGEFKRLAYSLALEHIEFWRRSRIFTEVSIARMLEVELTSELMILQIDGLQDKKTSINPFYSEYDEDFPASKTVAKRFRATIDTINDALGEGLPQSAFHRSPLFYTLFAAVYHRVYGVPKLRLATLKRRLSEQERRSLAQATMNLSEILTLARNDEAVPTRYLPFVGASSRQTDNIQPRTVRLETLYRAAFQ